MKKLNCDIDGNALCIFRDDFINLAESEAVFIDLTNEQIDAIGKLEPELLKYAVKTGDPK